jgi:hypothetical protein
VASPEEETMVAHAEEQGGAAEVGGGVAAVGNSTTRAENRGPGTARLVGDSRGLKL